MHAFDGWADERWAELSARVGVRLPRQHLPTALAPLTGLQALHGARYGSDVATYPPGSGVAAEAVYERQTGGRNRSALRIETGGGKGGGELAGGHGFLGRWARVINASSRLFLAYSNPSSHELMKARDHESLPLGLRMSSYGHSDSLAPEKNALTPLMKAPRIAGFHWKKLCGKAISMRFPFDLAGKQFLGLVKRQVSRAVAPRGAHSAVATSVVVFAFSPDPISAFHRDDGVTLSGLVGCDFECFHGDLLVGGLAQRAQGCLVAAGRHRVIVIRPRTIGQCRRITRCNVVVRATGRMEAPAVSGFAEHQVVGGVFGCVAHDHLLSVAASIRYRDASVSRGIACVNRDGDCFCLSRSGR